ncbi:uncharacterized protein LOC129767133 [Toxorhynchites rutilus septentrionalis]|uniref:uncharacterized protein LOC129767133 n=1 Tax=Toxorhynchites rutilus septentrionalis TaxID=329112 RepID=UPI0024798CD8|nr:uncharacterized protein LOC129767133 [Toxorhynchites rutilus septentrionalis]
MDNVVSVSMYNQEEQKFWLYLSRIRPDVTTEAVTAMAKANLQTNSDLAVVKLIPKDKNTSSHFYVFQKTTDTHTACSKFISCHSGNTVNGVLTCYDPRCKPANLMEVPNPFISVELFQPAINSHPGPEALPQASTPGCTPASLMEALNPLILVEYFQPALNSHPGPEFENGKGTSQTAIAGKYKSGISIYINPVLNRNGRLLDLVLANDAAVSRCSIAEATDPVIPLDIDHPALEVDVNLPSSIGFEVVPDLSCLNFQKADFAALNQAISRVDWEFLETIEDMDAAVARFTDIITRIIADCVPTRRAAQKPVWGNRRLRCPLVKQELNQRSNEYRLYNRFLNKQYTRLMQRNLRKNPNLFWSFVNSKRMEEGLPINMFLVNRSANTAIEKCNLFAAHFKRAFNGSTSSETQVDTAVRDTRLNALNFDIFRVTSEVVEAAIRKLKYSTSPGPDGIPSCVLKKCASCLVYPLSVLIDTSLHKSTFPSVWKQSIMFPVHKKGDKRNIENYRGITSLCACSKVFEIIVNDAVFSCCKNYLLQDQHGFFPKSMEQGTQVDSVYTDLNAAFDRVDHKILIARLNKLGISSRFTIWLNSYLTDRWMCVKIESAQSASFFNLSGVPQGSNLGPL